MTSYGEDPPSGAVREARGLEVVAPGPLATIQDLGRPGYASLGVGASGAADRAALRLANRLVSNAEGAAALEATLGGLVVRARGYLTVALAGASGPVTVAGRGAATHEVLALRDGALLRLGSPVAGLRTYLAVRGGLAVPPVLGSRATDTLSGIGPSRPAAGDVLPVGVRPDGWPPTDAAPVAPPPAGNLVLRARPGPRDDWFTPAAVDALFREPYEVSPESDRVGMRLHGPALERTRQEELPSEGMVRGALQVPPSGQPTLFLADHPVTGGYPVVAVLADADVDRAAQARPGQHLRFHPVR